VLESQELADSVFAAIPAEAKAMAAKGLPMAASGGDFRGFESRRHRRKSANAGLPGLCAVRLGSFRDERSGGVSGTEVTRLGPPDRSEQPGAVQERTATEALGWRIPAEAMAEEPAVIRSNVVLQT